jgi:hypothetical protein
VTTTKQNFNFKKGKLFKVQWDYYKASSDDFHLWKVVFYSEELTISLSCFSFRLHYFLCGWVSDVCGVVVLSLMGPSVVRWLSYCC